MCRQAMGILIVILVCHGACHPRSPEQEDFLTAAGFLDCGICGFTEADPEHIVNELRSRS